MSKRLLKEQNPWANFNVIDSLSLFDPSKTNKYLPLLLKQYKISEGEIPKPPLKEIKYSPITGNPMKQMVDEQRTISYNGQDITFRFHYWLCEDTGEKFTTNSDDHINIMNLKSKYKDII